MRFGIFGKAASMLAASLAVAATAQQSGEAPASPANLSIPSNPQFIGRSDPSVRKATAIVNGEVITATDVDQRLALIVLANGGQVPADELDRLRLQVLRNLIDETLQIQAATAEEIKVEDNEVERYYGEYLRNQRRSPDEFASFLRQAGSSVNSIKRQIRGDLSWSRLQSRQIQPFVNVSDEEVRSVIARLEASKGAQEYRVSEIFLAGTPETMAQTMANANQILQQLRAGGSFLAYARQYSQATTAAVGGDLGWVRAEQLPDELAAAVRAAPVGSVSNPIPIPGGVSIIAVQDTRKVLTADARDAMLSLKQVSVRFPAGTTQAQAAPKLDALARAAQSMGGCGGAGKAAASIGAEVVSNDQVRARDLPAQLQSMLLSLSIGQATQPFGSIQDRVSVLVLCGRDDPQVAGGPSFDAVQNQLSEERVSRRAQRYLRDLRSDAVIDYR